MYFWVVMRQPLLSMLAIDVVLGNNETVRHFVSSWLQLNDPVKGSPKR